MTDMHETTQSPEMDDATEQDAMQDVVDRMLEGDDYTDEFTAKGNGEEITFDVAPIRDREKRYDYLARMGLSSIPLSDIERHTVEFDGETVTAMEDMAVESFSHEHLTESVIRMLVESFSDDVLFEAFDTIISLSEEVGSIDEFHRE